MKEIFEEEIISKLFNDPEYFGGVMPFLKKRYFGEAGNAEVFGSIAEFYSKYGSKPSMRDIIIMLKDKPQAVKDVAVKSIRKINEAKVPVSGEMLEEKTEEFIKNAIFTESLIAGAEAMSTGDDAKKAKSFALAEEAFKVSLNNDFGLVIDDVEKRIDYYQTELNGYKVNIPSFDDMIGPGFLKKTLNVVGAPSGVGKSAALCAFSSEFLLQGQDVVIFTLEMREEEYFKRIDCNILDIPIWDLDKVDPEVIKSKYEKIKNDVGTLHVKEFATGSLNSLMVQSYLEKLKVEKGISSPIVVVDYLGLMASHRVKPDIGPYSYYKSITEELRAVAQKLDLCILTAVQLNRSANQNLEAGNEAVSDSNGVIMTADSVFMLLQTKQMKHDKELMVNFTKNRMSGKTWDFKIGFDYGKMKFEDRFYQGASGGNPQNPPSNSYNSVASIDTGLDLGGAVGFSM